jgi:hypothetical protein
MTNTEGPHRKHIDHIIPITIGGTHTHGNVRVICATCNLTRPNDGSDLAQHQPTLWALDLNAAQAAAVLKAQRQQRPRKPNLHKIRRQKRHALQEQLWTERARAAAAARRLGLSWKQIAELLGYASDGAAHNSIRLRLHIDPKRLSNSR